MLTLFEVIQEVDQQLFLWLNSLHLPWLDPVMYGITSKYTWFPLYALLAIFLIVKYRWAGIRMLLLLVLIIIACDQLTSGLMKPYFERLRPCYHPIIAHRVHLVEGCGGQYGFASSHAANTFGLATGTWLLFRHWSRLFVWGFVWATVVSYSRIYVGVHYPLDILVGALIGITLATIFYQLYNLLNHRWLGTSSPKNH